MAEKRALSVDVGIETIEIKDSSGVILGEFLFNPSDSNIIDRYYKVVDFFDNYPHKECETEDEEAREASKFCAAVREQINALLGFEVADGIFGKCGPMTVTPSGVWYLSMVLSGIGDLISEVTGERVAAGEKLSKSLKKVEKATAKYNKK